MMPRVWIMVALLALTACGTRQSTTDGETNLRQMRNPSGTPEEFSIVPSNPLQAPQSLAELPAPTPGGTNLADPTPLGDAVAALGGSPSRLDQQGGIGQGDQALVARAARFGTAPNIRAELAEADQAFRKRRSLFNWRLIPEDTYNRVYGPQALDPYATLEAARRAGLRTPSAPPR